MDPREHALDDARRVQHGVFSLSQALAAGFSRSGVRRRVAAGRWIEVGERSFMVATGVPPTDRQVLVALTLSARAAASGRSAAALYDLLPFPSVPEVTVVRSRRSLRHDVVHSSRALPDRDLTMVDGIPVTTAVRTVIDVAGQLSALAAEHLVDTAVARGLVSVRRLERRAQELATPRRRGCAVVLRALGEASDLGKVRSPLEARALRLIVRAGAPPPRVNHRVRCNGQIREIDLAWPDLRIAVEVDGFGPHRGRRAFDEDRSRQNDLVAAGWTGFRLTWTSLRDDSARALAPIHAEIARRSS